MTDAAKTTPPLVYRVQDRQGRGPFKPGMTDRWRDPDGNDFPPIQAEFGLAWREEIPRGWHCGCAFRDPSQAGEWFSAAECGRLASLGYHLVALAGCRVLRESPHQMIVARPAAFRLRASPVAWPHMAPAALDPWRMAHVG